YRTLDIYVSGTKLVNTEEMGEQVRQELLEG
ncbi:MAG: hypothetical protein PWP31_1842, partial [Clostridia bacterium]|nr:hypothetical protein [Clostridia bacterium]MDK2901376.1 hypothetical protein [Thermosediminibacterales bacterium]